MKLRFERGERRPRLGVRWLQLVGFLLALLALAGPRTVQAAAPAVSVVVENPSNPIQPGQTLVYRIHVSNPNPTTPTGALVVEANVPQHMAVNRPPGGVCSPDRCDLSTTVARFGNVVSWKIADLAPAGSTVLELRGSVDNSNQFPPPADGDSMALDIIVKSGSAKVASVTSTVVAANTAPTFDLALSGATRATPGAALELRLRYGNRGASAAGAQLRLALPAGVRVSAASEGAVLDGNQLGWDLGSVPGGFSDFRDVRLELDPKAKLGSLALFGAELSGGGQRSPSRASRAVLIGADSALGIVVKSTPDPAVPAGTIVYKIELTNRSGNAPTGAFSVRAGVPRYATVSKLQTGDCVPERCDLSTTFANYGNDIVWKVASLDPGASTELQFAAVVDKPTAAAPPPNGSLLDVDVTAFFAGATRTSASVVLGTSKTVGKGKPLAPLAAPAAAAPAPVAQAPAPSPAATEAPSTVPEPPEQFVEDDDEPEAATVAAAPSEKDKKGHDKAKHARDARWHIARRAWSKYCIAKWQKKEWDRRCLLRWRHHRDWGKRQAWWKGNWKGDH